MSTPIEIVNHYSKDCPGCAFAPYRTHQHAPYRFHVTSTSRAAQSWYHLVKLNEPKRAEAAINSCDCEWGQRREVVMREKGEILKPCIHILQAKAEHDRLHAPRVVESNGEELFAGEEPAALVGSGPRTKGTRLEDLFSA